jgi:hypothetical protein
MLSTRYAQVNPNPQSAVSPAAAAAALLAATAAAAAAARSFKLSAKPSAASVHL